MQASLRKQRGLTLISIGFILGLIGFFVLLFLKIAPLYFNNSKVKTAVEGVKNTTDIVSKSRPEIKAALRKRLDMNYADNIKDEDITLIAQPGYVKLDVDYERVEPIVGNLSVLVVFHEGFEVGSR